MILLTALLYLATNNLVLVSCCHLACENTSFFLAIILSLRERFYPQKVDTRGLGLQRFV